VEHLKESPLKAIGLTHKHYTRLVTNTALLRTFVNHGCIIEPRGHIHNSSFSSMKVFNKLAGLSLSSLSGQAYSVSYEENGNKATLSKCNKLECLYIASL
jgi:hypothetical protein